jgi:pSer/pThr/pTyr-binding forkhead associated (FHA) protein
MKGLVWTFLMVAFLVSFTFSLCAAEETMTSEDRSGNKEVSITEDMKTLEDGFANKEIPTTEERATSEGSSDTEEGKSKKPVSLATLIIAIVVIVIIALGTIGIVILVIVKGGKKTSKKKKNEAMSQSIPSSASENPFAQNLPEAELRDLSQVTDKESFEVKIPVTSIGREYGNDIIIPKNTVSSRHGTIEYRGGYFYLVDHRSSNGTYLNGTKIPGEVKLKSGDLISFDVFKFQFIIPTLTALGPKVSHYNPEESGMTILRPQQRTSASDNKSEGKGQQKGFSPEATEKINYKNRTPQHDSPPPAYPSSESGPKTMLKLRICPNHPQQRATKTCSQCRQNFCVQCISVKKGIVICKMCEKNNL